jgi:hypothetical protein
MPAGHYVVTVRIVPVGPGFVAGAPIERRMEIDWDPQAPSTEAASSSSASRTTPLELSKRVALTRGPVPRAS